MRFRKLANTDIRVSVVGFGGWSIIGGFTWGPQDDKDSVEALRAAYDAGITFFDTAEGYDNGHSEQLVAEALSSVRDRVVIATKVSVEHFAPDDLRAACDRSLRNLRTDRIDLYQLHWPSRNHPFEETLAVLDELKQAGKIRAYGVSNFGRESLPLVLQTPYRPVSNQLAYSAVFRAIEFEILPICVKNHISVLCYAALMQGLLTGKFASPDDVPVTRARSRHFSSKRPHAIHGEPGAEEETFAAVRKVGEIAQRLQQPMGDVAIAWLLARKGVTSVIAGGRNAQQARENARAGDLVLPADAVREITAATETVKQKLGSNADFWRSDSRVW